MKYLSTFSGIGGFEIGIQRAFMRHQNSILCGSGSPTGSSQRPTKQLSEFSVQGLSCIGYSEVDQHAIKTYEEHYDHTNYGDITAINAESLPDFDLIVGGFPCQAFSVAGKRRGFDETRGTLFFDLARILKHKRPGHFVFENVKGLLSHDGGKTIQTIAGVLSDLGYRIEWQVLNSKDFGVPQNRERIYIVGHLRDRCSRQVLPITGQSNGYTTLGLTTETAVARTLTAGGHSGGNHSGMTILQLNQPKHSNDRVYGDDGISPTLNTMQGGMRQPFVQIKEATKLGYAEATVGDTLNISMPTSKTRRGRVQRGLAGTLQTSESMATLTPDARIRRLTPTECHRLQGFPDGWCVGSDSQQYKQLGNAVTTNVVEAVMLRLKECLK